MQKGGINVGCK